MLLQHADPVEVADLEGINRILRYPLTMTSSLPQPARFQLDQAGYRLLRDGRAVRLERQPMELLILLATRKDELVSRDEIAARLWGTDVFVDAEQSINRIVRKLRVALNDDPERPQFIETVVGKGYRFIGSIEAITRRTIETPIAEGTASASVEPGKRSPARRHAAIGVAVVGIGVVLAVVIRQFGVHPATTLIRTIAVLPFENMSGDAGQDFFADGMTDELTTDLAKIGSLNVISRTSANRYRGRHETLAQIGRALNVNAIIEGSVVRAGGKVRITVQLIDVATERHLWADSYERDLEDVLRVQSTVALEVAHQVRVTLTTSEQARLEAHRSVNSDAYDAYLRGRYLLTTQSPDALRAAEAAFQQAIRLDPTYAAAYSGLSDSFSLLANYGVLSPGVAFPQAAAAANRSLTLDGTLAEAHASLGFAKQHYDWDWVGAEQEYKRAVQLSPSSTTTHLRYAELLSTLGRHDEAVAEIERAAALDPLSPLVASNVGRILYYARRYDEAIAVLTKALALDPSRVYSRIHLARCYEQKGMYADGLAEFERIKVFFNGQAGVGFAHFYAVTGHRQEAKALLRNLLQQPGDSDWFFLAGVYVALGDSDRAFASLETAYAKHDFYLPFLKVDPIMDPIRSDPRYTGLLVRLGMV